MDQLPDQAYYTQSFWAKAWPYRQRGPDRIHLLEHHLADVGVCLEALLSQPTIRHRLAYSARREVLDDVTVARLCVFAALHDIGKVNVGFQTQVWKPTDFENERRVQRAGHTLDLVPVLIGHDREASGWFFKALGWDDFIAWDDREGRVVSDLLVATLSHHGLPLVLSGPQKNPRIWRPYGSLHPESYVRRVAALLRRWFPDAWVGSAPPLPREPAFQHMFLGLCTLADWLGSNEQWFPYTRVPDPNYVSKVRERAENALKVCGLDVQAQRWAVDKQVSYPNFSDLFGFARPNAIQRQAAVDTPLDERLVVVESETGSGKTEAALWRFDRLYRAKLVDGLYFALPTRAAATQMYHRIREFVSSAMPTGFTPQVVLAVPGYLMDGEISGRLLHQYDVWWDDHPDDATRGRRWASEHSKRYLAAQIAVGTVDQAMLSVLKVKHSHMRGACLSRNLLVVDEVHASDTYMRVILRSLLEAHLDTGGHALLMSATLGSVARREWLGVPGDIPLTEAIRSPYPAVTTRAESGELITATEDNGQGKTVHISSVPLMGEFDAVASLVLKAVRRGAKVLIIRNTVGYAVRTQLAIERRVSRAEEALVFTCEGVAAPHHGRFAAGDRARLDRLIEERLGRHRGRSYLGLAVVGTQTLEQSLDIDADLIVTDLSPVDVLLQRIGRLHRHARGDRPRGYRTPRCVVLLPTGGDLTPLLERGLNGLNQFVYQDLRILEATRRLVADDPEWVIPSMNRELVERATHPTVLDEITAELGEAWRSHGDRVVGGELAEGLTARRAIVARDKSFCGDNHEIGFGSMEEKIRTRLGDEGIEIALDPPQSSPFGGAWIDRLVVPRRWLPDTWADGASEPTSDRDGFQFNVGARQFHYSRLGLRRRTT